MSRIIVVSGPEGAGNRLWKRILVNSTGFCADSKPTDAWWAGAPFAPPGKDWITRKTLPRLELGYVTRRSMPDGPLEQGRHFPNLIDFGRRANSAGYITKFVLLTRDRTALLRSKIREHTGGSAELAEKELERAWRLMADVLKVFGPDAVIASYEALMTLKADYVNQVLGLLGLELWAQVQDLHDGNAKYFEAGPSW